MITCVAVVDRIDACLASVARAQAELVHRRGGAVSSRTVVVLDGCRDGTADVVDQYPAVDALVSEARCVGAARLLGAARAVSLAARVPLTELWLASTDADCQVPLDWLATMVSCADAGADLVLGTVWPGPGLAAQVHDAWVAAHDLVAGHEHVHAANLGIRASSYVEVGGWRALPHSEDLDLVTRALTRPDVLIERRADLPVRNIPARAARRE